MNTPVNNEYLDAAGQCPCCGSDNTEVIRERRDPQADRRFIEYQCADCGVSFTEIYAEVMALGGKIVDGTLHLTESQYAAGPAAEDALELLEALETLVFDLTEAHEAEIMDDHGGDDPESCSYCQDIARAQRLIDGIRGVEVESDADARGNEKEKDGDA
jgi:predicted nucleic-acid-binding Zn-ribbon protein